MNNFIKIICEKAQGQNLKEFFHNVILLSDEFGMLNYHSLANKDQCLTHYQDLYGILRREPS